MMLLVAATALAAAKPPAGQASITLSDCNAELCHANNTAWNLTKSPSSQSVTLPDDPPAITWTVAATRGATSANYLTVDGVLTVTNTGTANATIGNIVINLQKKIVNTSNWVSVAADVADATNGNAATVGNIVASASAESASVNASFGPPNYTVSGARGTFVETLLYTAQFNNSVLGLAPGAQVRSEALVTFGNAGLRGGSGASAANIDVNGNGTIDTDEANVRTVPCRVSRTVPPLKAGNDAVTLSDAASDVAVSGSGIGSTNFLTGLGLDGTGSGEVISGDRTATVSVDATCTPPGSGTITNTAHLNGESCSVTVQGPQIGTDPITGLPVYQQISFPCVTGVDLDASASANVACEEQHQGPPNVCTYTQGGFQGGGVPAQLYTANYQIVFPGGLTIGINDGVGPRHNASWTANSTGQNALKTYLAGGGPSGALTADTVNATSTSGGTLAKQTAALTLNVGFGIKMVGGTPTVDTSGLGGLQLCNLTAGSTIGSWTLTGPQAAALNGTSVSSVLTGANGALGGNGLPGYVGSFGDLNQLVTALNESFDNCTANAFATANLCVAPPI
ncbi:MAG: hypothetical protein DMF53_29375 [Acidobacteria bacterium]|nr:MAG: hypothetical protein DMF53_29375 [Acidobacteriota bacterium]